MDVLVSGSERPPGDRGRRVLAWRPPVAAVVAVAVAGAAVLAGGVAALAPVREAADRPQLSADGRSVVTVRTRGRDGVLVLRLRNDGSRSVVVRQAVLDVEGVRGGREVPGQEIRPGQVVELPVPFTLPRCPAAPPTGRLTVTTGAGEVDLPVGPGEALPAHLLTPGCGPPRPDAVAVSVRSTGGFREVLDDGITGRLVLDVTLAGPGLDIVRVGAEVPGVVVSGASFLSPGGGATVEARLVFRVPDCALLRRTGRVVVEVLDDDVGRHELGFRVTEDEEARTVRDVDADVLLRGCRDGAPVPPQE